MLNSSVNISGLPDNSELDPPLVTLSGNTYDISIGSTNSSKTINDTANISIDNSINNNAIRVFNDVFDSDSTGNFGSAYGINFGNGIMDTTLTNTTGCSVDSSIYDNTIIAVNDIFNVKQINAGTAYGINFK